MSLPACEADAAAPKPRWMCELERLAAYKTQLYLFGNVKDQIFYPLDRELQGWTIGSLREALFEIFRHQLGQYDIVASYTPVEGMIFADYAEGNTMARTYDQVLQQVSKALPPPPGGTAPQAIKSDDPVIHALQQISLCLRNNAKSCAFILEQAPQFVTGQANLPLNERLLLMRLLRAAGESTVVYTGEGAQRRATQNLLVLTCDNPRDFPPWLYMNNPFCGSIALEAPGRAERRRFFAWRFRVPADATAILEGRFDLEELSDLTDGMCLRDLWGIAVLADRAAAYDITKTKALVDAYKYGARRSEWDNLPWARLQQAEAILARRVKGQSAAIGAVSDVLRRARLGLSGAQHSSRSKPRGVLFFAGPTGVGKTELAKSIAELVFSAEERCVRFDMSEFSQSHADQRLLGAPPGYVGYEEGGQLTNRVKSDPFCVLLFDEIEKAHPSILDKFLQILEDGRMTDGHGETVYFSESIIVFTSNVGIYQLDAQTGRPLINPADGKPLLQVDPTVDTEYEVVRRKVLEGVQNYFKYVLGRPELLNRIGQNIIVFDFVRAPIMRQILEAKVLKSIRTQVQDRWGVEVAFAPAVIDQLMELGGHDVASGGRGIGNLAEQAVLNPIARVLFALLEEDEAGSLAGKTLTIDAIIPPTAETEQRYELTWTIA